jgi:hypothetical protein
MKTYLPIVLIFSLLCGGCSLFKKKDSITVIPEMNTQEDISQAQITIENSTKEIKTATNDISLATQTIKDEVDNTIGIIPTEIKTTISPHLDKINESSTSISQNVQQINTSVAGLRGANSLLDNAEKKISNIEQALQKIEKERDTAIKDKNKAIQDKNSQMHKALRWLIVGCILLAGVFAVLFVLHGSKFGLTGAAICAVVCAIAIFVQTYFVYMAIAGGIILLGLVGILIYNIVIKNKAFKEVVKTVEVVQDNITTKIKEKLFGGEGETGLMNTIQSASTMALVKKEKSKLDKLWDYAKNKNSTDGTETSVT